MYRITERRKLSYLAEKSRILCNTDFFIFSFNFINLLTIEEYDSVKNGSKDTVYMYRENHN